MLATRFRNACLASLAGTCLAFAAGTAAAENFTLRIVHMNDFHSRVEAINKYGSTCSSKEQAENKCLGGSARIKTAIDAARAENPDVLVLDAGDQFQGSLFYTTYKGMAEVEMMNAIGYDAMAIGNHEFDDGPDALKAFMDKAKFPMVSANTIVTGDNRFPDGFKPYVIVERKGRKIGIVGALAEDTDTTSSPGPTVSFKQAESVLPAVVKELEGQGVNVILLLSHLGIVRDMQVGAAVPGIDAIIGGHTHVLLSNSLKGAYGPYPTIAEGKDGAKVPVVTAGSYGRYLGDLTLTFDDAGKVVSWSGDTRELDASVAEDPAIIARVKELAGPIESVKAKVVGEAKVVMDGERESCRLKECTMANLIADAMLEATKNSGTTIAIQNGGGVRASIDAGPVTMGEVLTVLPFQNAVATFELKGSDVVAALENGVSQVEDIAGRFPQVAGMRYSWDGSKPAGSRILKVEVPDGKGGWAPIQPDQVYKVASNDFMRAGGDGYAVFKDKAMNPYDFGPSLEITVADYIGAHSPVEPKLEGRITRVDK